MMDLPPPRRKREWTRRPTGFTKPSKPCEPILKDRPIKKSEEKKTEKPPMAAGGGPGFRGAVTLKGQPLAGGSVIFVSLDKPKPVVIAAEIQGNGQYAPLQGVPPGKYVVIVQGKGVPEKYQLTTTSGLMVDVQAPPMVYDIVLQ